MVRNAYQGIGTEYETLLRAFDKENEAFVERVGKDRSLSTYQKYLTVRKYLAEFIKLHYKRTDIAMNELTEDFIRDYCFTLTANRIPISQWFSEQYDKFRQSIRQPIQPKKSRGMKL